MRCNGRQVKVALAVGGLVCLVIAFMGFGLLCLSRSRSFQVFGTIVHRVETNERVVALTFDDGPVPGATDEILSILDEAETSGTFFLTGRELERHGDLGKRIAESGHEIGNHTYAHRRMVLKSPGFIADEIEKTDKLIKAAGYDGVALFRPPYGKKLLGLPWYLERNNRVSITWDVEPESFRDIASDSGKIVDHVVENARPGSIILLHVMYDKERKSMKAVRPIIDRLREKGMRFVTVSSLLALREH